MCFSITSFARRLLQGMESYSRVMGFWMIYTRIFDVKYSYYGYLKTFMRAYNFEINNNTGSFIAISLFY